MPSSRCLWCTDPPLEEVAVLKWRPGPGGTRNDEERLTIQLCGKHLKRVRDAGDKGREIKGAFYKTGWW